MAPEANPNGEVIATTAPQIHPLPMTTADRMPTGAFVGVLLSGHLYRRSDHLKSWRKRFFVLTHVALHRFDASVNGDNVRESKPRGYVLLRQCRRVRYEKFARPHEFEVELVDGKLLSLQSTDALLCAKWASVLANAIDAPHWVHDDRNTLTVWRSDTKFISSKCPYVTSVTCSTFELNSKSHIVASAPAWGEVIPLGTLKANSRVSIHMSDGANFGLSLEDLVSALAHPIWVATNTSMRVRRMRGATQPEEFDTLPKELLLNKQLKASPNGTDIANTRRSSRFTLRLKYRADTQRQPRMSPQRRHLLKISGAALGLSGVLVGVIMVVAVLTFFRASAGVVTGVAFSWIFACGWLSPIVWCAYEQFVCKESFKSDLVWVFTLIALELRPGVSVKPVEDRLSTASSSTDQTDDIQDCLFQSLCMHESQSAMIRSFRLENALEAILARPQFLFDPISKFFPHRFIEKDQMGRHVMHIALTAVSWHDLKAHNVSPIDILHHFLFMWEYLWSFADFQEGVSHSELVIVVDCTNADFSIWFRDELQITMSLLRMTDFYYPGRLARVIVVGDVMSSAFYPSILLRLMPIGLANKVDFASSINEVVGQPETPSQSLQFAQSRDSIALKEYVDRLLATFAHVAIPIISRKDMEQARIRASSVTLEAPYAGDSATPQDGENRPSFTTSQLPISWERVERRQGTVLYRSISQYHGFTHWRGFTKLRTNNVKLVARYLQEPELWKRWNNQEEAFEILDSISPSEQICRWDRSIRLPERQHFWSFVQSRSRKKCFFPCVARCMAVSSKSEDTQSEEVYTVLYKTASSQASCLPLTQDTAEEDHVRSRGPCASLWGPLEGSYSQVCFVVEPGSSKTAPLPARRRKNALRSEDPEPTVTLSFWMQTTSCSPDKNREVRSLKEKCFITLTNLML